MGQLRTQHVWLVLGAKAAALAVALLASLTLGGGPAAAAISNCSVSTAGVAFSPYDTAAKLAVDALATISVTCSGSGTESNISLNLSGGNTGSCSTREMRNGAAALGYQIYRDAGRSSAWCDGRDRLDLEFVFTTPTVTHTFTMYGRVLAGQNPSLGAYSDMLTATLKKGGGNLASGSVPISGLVGGSCSLAASSLGFGTYDPATTLNSSASLTVNCTSGTAYTLSLGGGANLSGGVRRMAGPSGSFLSYHLFSDPARTSVWGDGTSLGPKVNGSGNGGNQNVPVYGRIGANQFVRPGNYSDTVQVTIEY